MIIMIKLTHLLILSLRVVNIIIMIILTTENQGGHNHNYGHPDHRELSYNWVVNIIIIGGQLYNRRWSI